MANVKVTFWKAGSKPGLLLDTWIIENGVAVEGALIRYKSAKVLGVDTETTALDPLMPPAKIRLLQLTDGRDVTIFDLWKLGRESIGWIMKFLEDPSRVKVIQNGKFDLKFLIHQFGIGRVWPLFDTQIVGQLLDLGDEFGKHDLGSLIRIYLGETSDKDVRHVWWGELTPWQLTYASNDCARLPRLRETMVEQVKERGLVQASLLELRCVQPTAQQELNGMLLDRSKWLDILRQNKVECAEVEERLFEILEPGSGDNMDFFGRSRATFNLDSADEVKKRLKALGLTLPTVLDKDTGKIKDTTELDKMAQIADLHPVIALLIRHRRLRRQITSYGNKFLRWINPHDGRAHPDVRQIGTVTTRNGVREPPMHGIPKQSDHRECFVARPGWELSWADYSQIELRILAEFSEDSNMLQAFRDGIDLHTQAASLLFNVDYDSVVTVQRRRAKDINFGKPYGVGYKRYAERAGIPEAEAQKLMAAHDAKYPRQNEYLNQAAQHARVYGYSTTMSGKVITYRFDRNDKGQLAAVGRHGKNYPIQGSSADITKTAVARVDDRLRELFPGIPPAEWLIQHVHTVHDEIVLEHRVDMRETARRILHDEMKAAGELFLKIVPVVVDVETNTFWAKAKDD